MKGTPQKIEVDGILFKSMAAAAKHLKIEPGTLTNWFARGYNEDEIELKIHRALANKNKAAFAKRKQKRRNQILKEYGNVTSYLMQTSKFAQHKSN